MATASPAAAAAAGPIVLDSTPNTRSGRRKPSGDSSERRGLVIHIGQRLTNLAPTENAAIAAAAAPAAVPPTADADAGSTAVAGAGIGTNAQQHNCAQQAQTGQQPQHQTAQQQQQPQQQNEHQQHQARRHQQVERNRPRAAADVIIIDSDDSADERDDDVIITEVVRKRPRAGAGSAPQQQHRGRQQPAVRRPGAGPAIPTWQPEPAPQREGSPEPAIKCLICLEGIKNECMATTPCGHLFCYGCLLDAVKVTKKCPKCRKSVQQKQVKRLYPN